MKDDTRKFLVRLAFLIAVAGIGGSLFVMNWPLFGEFRLRTNSGVQLIPFTLLTVVGSFACLVVGRGHWSQYVVLALIWAFWLVLLLPVLSF